MNMRTKNPSPEAVGRGFGLFICPTLTVILNLKLHCVDQYFVFWFFCICSNFKIWFCAVNVNNET